ncbi:unnamed protein product [Discosporangium mesarthrocarpum]
MKGTLSLFLAGVVVSTSAFLQPSIQAGGNRQHVVLMAAEVLPDGPVSRRQCMASAALAAAGFIAGASGRATGASARDSPKVVPRARLPDDDKQGSNYLPLGDGGVMKPRLLYPDFVSTENGLQYKDAKVGSGVAAAMGDRVVMDWEGYTIGYNGGVFESKSGPKGGAFDESKDAYRFVVGQGTTIPALEQGVMGMKAGGVRQIIVPPELGYPSGDPKHERVGPKPTTFSGSRALDFVLTNPGFIDKTLLINVRMVRIDKPGERGFKGLKR